jgi:hypothetical protein
MDQDFRGSTYDPNQDRDRLMNYTQRVFSLLLDGAWHTPAQLREVGGGEWSRRVRNLREPRFGGFSVDTSRDPDKPGKWLYRLLDVDQISQAQIDAVMRGDVDDRNPLAPSTQKDRETRLRKCINRRVGRMPEDWLRMLEQWMTHGLPVEMAKRQAASAQQAALRL